MPQHVGVDNSSEFRTSWRARTATPGRPWRWCSTTAAPALAGLSQEYECSWSAAGHHRYATRSTPRRAGRHRPRGGASPGRESRHAWPARAHPAGPAPRPARDRERGGRRSSCMDSPRSGGSVPRRRVRDTQDGPDDSMAGARHPKPVFPQAANVHPDGDLDAAHDAVERLARGDSSWKVGNRGAPITARVLIDALTMTPLRRRLRFERSAGGHGRPRDIRSLRDRPGSSMDPRHENFSFTQRRVRCDRSDPVRADHSSRQRETTSDSWLTAAASRKPSSSASRTTSTSLPRLLPGCSGAGSRPNATGSPG